jgi:DNA-binding response OmpR family regulator
MAGGFPSTMLRCFESDEIPILVAMSAPHDVRLAEGALDELGLGAEWVADGVEALRDLCRDPLGYAVVIVGERVGSISGWTLCGLARDARVSASLLLVTGDDTRLSAARGAMLDVSILWRPTSPQRLARAIGALLPRAEGLRPR